MSPDWQTVFIVGPPGAGKSAIGRAVAERLEVTFRTIDEWTPRGEPMTDAQVQCALTQLFRATHPTNEIVEFCHHNYQSLLEIGAYPIFDTSRKVIITAPLSLCKARNNLRRSPVRNTYIERAWQSTQSLIDICSTDRAPRFIVVDTSDQSLGASIATVARFMIEREEDHE